MKKYILTFFSFWIINISFCQSNIAEINFGDSSVSNFIKKNLEKINYSDTCFSGITYVIYKLSSVNNIIFSNSRIPQIYLDTIKALLISLKGSWNKNFLSHINKTNTHIILPIYFSVYKKCILKPTIQRGKSDFSKNFTECDEMIFDLNRIIVTFENTFENTGNQFDDIQKYHNSIFLKPIIVR